MSSPDSSAEGTERETLDPEEAYGDDDLDLAAAEELDEPFVAVTFEEAGAEAAGAAPAAPPPDLDAVVRERDEYLDTLRRLQAEFDNYRKRIARQQAESTERATGSLLERLLPVLDALDLALVHGEANGLEPSDDRQALTQIASLLRDTLGKEGLERIDAVEVAFDPNVHDAVVHVDKEPSDASPGAVVGQVLRAGYLLNGRVVRPAMVQVRG